MTTIAQSKFGGARVYVPPPLVFLGLIVSGVVAQRSLGALTVSLPFWPRVLAGTLALLGGVVILLSARRWFTRTGQDPAPWQPSPELLVSGIYRYTRNPMYLGMTLFQVGLGVALDNVWIAALALPGLAVVHVFAVRPEEAYLTEKFGDSYLRYQAAVRRYL